MTINKLEDINEITIWSPIVERWELKWEPETYLRMYMKFLTFRDADLSYLEDYVDEIIGKSDVEFISWLISRSVEEGTTVQIGSPIFYFIDNAFPGNYNDYKMEQYFVESSKKSIAVGSQELDDLMFEMGWRQSESQPSELSDQIFASEQDAINAMSAEHSYFELIEQDRADGF